MYLYLVRHGQSEGNARRLFFGHTDYPLTALGREQARQAADKLRAVSFSRCVASDLLRAWETAEICVGSRALRPEKCPALREQFMGTLEGCDWAQSRELYGDLIDAFVHNWYDTVPPTVEPPTAMEARVAACVDDVLARGEDTLLVAHNGSLSLALKHLGLMGLDVLMQPEHAFRHGCYSAIRIGEDGKAVLEGFNL